LNAPLKAPIALAFALAVPFLASPAVSAPAHKTTHRLGHHSAMDFTAASALANPVAPVTDDHKTDGLSRNPEDCSRGGCIGNN
jgi:hypothetical protein